MVSVFNKNELITEMLIKSGFKLNYTLTKQEEFNKNEIFLATEGDKETLICLDGVIADETRLTLILKLLYHQVYYSL